MTREDLEHAVDEIFSGMSGNGATLFTGPRGIEEFQRAMEEEAGNIAQQHAITNPSPIPIPEGRFPLTFLTEAIGEDFNSEPEYNHEIHMEASEMQDASEYTIYQDPAVIDTINEIPINGFLDMGSDTVLFIGGPADKEKRACQYPEYEMVYQRDPQPIMQNPGDGIYREEKTLVIDSDGNQKWVGWTSEDPQPEPMPEIHKFRYRILHVDAQIRGIRARARYAVPVDWVTDDHDYARSLDDIIRIVRDNNTGVTPQQIGSMFAPVDIGPMISPHGHLVADFDGTPGRPSEEESMRAQGIMAQMEDVEIPRFNENLELNMEPVTGTIEYTSNTDEEEITEEEIGFAQRMRNLYNSMTS